MIQEYEEVIEVLERFYQRKDAQGPKRDPREIAQGLFRLADVGGMVEITGSPWPGCPQWFASHSPLWMRREADRLIRLMSLSSNFGYALSPHEHTPRELRMVRLAARTCAKLETQLLKERSSS